MAASDRPGRAGRRSASSQPRGQGFKARPLLASAGQDPSWWGEGLCVTGNVTKTGTGAVCRGLTGETGWHAARQRGTRYTTSPAISGRVAQKYCLPPATMLAGPDAHSHGIRLGGALSRVDYLWLRRYRSIGLLLPRSARSARFQRTVPRGLFHYRSIGSSALATGRDHDAV